MNEWIEELSDQVAGGERAVVVTVAGIRGSAPREVGAKMIVTPTETLGTIGGGQLEYQCTRLAFDMLDGPEQPSLHKFPLGSAMGQCCGGVVDILFEPIASGLPGWLRDLRALHGQRVPAVIATRVSGSPLKCVITSDNTYGASAGQVGIEIIGRARYGLDTGRIVHRSDDWLLEFVIGSDRNIAVFGAGHVGSAVVQVLSSLDCNIRWIDSRRNIFRHTPANVRAIETADPALEVASMPPGSCFLVMTHSHALDYEICDRILRRRDAAYCGLIGSQSKRRRFEKRYRAEGLPEEALAALVCPIGITGISGKKPAEIALAAAAEVLQSHESMRAAAEFAYPANVHPLRGKHSP